MVRRLSQRSGPIRHLRANRLGDRAARAGPWPVRSTRARTCVPSPASSRDKLDPSRRSNDEAGRAQDLPSLRRLHARVSTDSGLEQDFNSLDNQREASEAYIKSADAYVVARVSVRRSLWLADTERKSRLTGISVARLRRIQASPRG